MRTVLVHLADQRRSRTDSHGIINFTLGLVGALPAALAPDERLVVHANDEIVDELDTSALRAQDELVVVPAPSGAVRRLLVDHVAAPRLAKRVGADVVLYPKGFLPVAPRRGGARPVPVVHDDIPAREREDRSIPLRRRARAAYFTALLRGSVRRGAPCLFVSGFTGDQVAARWGAPPGGSAVVHEGITLPRVERLPLDDRAPQVLVLGSPLAHKRTMAGLDLIAGDERLQEELDRVVLVGWHDGSRRSVGRLALEHRPGPLSGLELARLMASSRLLVYPSTYEGFGLPPIEALALGTPVVRRSTGAGEEVLPAVPGTFPDEDPAAFAAAVAAALALDDDALAALAADVRARFEWSAVARRVVAALRAPQPAPEPA